MNTILQVRIPGEPIAWKRHKGYGLKSWNPLDAKKIAFQWEVKAAWPNLKMNYDSRLGIQLTFWSTAAPIVRKGTSETSRQFEADLDNYAKFIFDMGTGFLWFNDSQIDRAELRVEREAKFGQTEIKLWEI